MQEKVRTAVVRSAERPLWAAIGASLGLLAFSWVMLHHHHHRPGDVTDALEALRYAAFAIACIGAGWLPFAWAGRHLEAAWASRETKRQARLVKEADRLENLFQYPAPTVAGSPSGGLDRRQLNELAEQVEALAAATRGNSLKVNGLVTTFAELLPEYGHAAEGLQETTPMLRLVKDSDEEKDSA